MLLETQFDPWPGPLHKYDLILLPFPAGFAGGFMRATTTGKKDVGVFELEHHSVGRQTHPHWSGSVDGYIIGVNNTQSEVVSWGSS